MRILIVEDEYSIARDIEYQCRAILGDRVTSLRILQTLEEAAEHLNKQTIDLLLLDLNLGGKNGYDLLTDTTCSVSRSPAPSIRSSSPPIPIKPSELSNTAFSTFCPSRWNTFA